MSEADSPLVASQCVECSCTTSHYSERHTARSLRNATGLVRAQFVKQGAWSAGTGPLQESQRCICFSEPSAPPAPSCS